MDTPTKKAGTWMGTLGRERKMLGETLGAARSMATLLPELALAKEGPAADYRCRRAGRSFDRSSLGDGLMSSGASVLQVRRM
jgi:hypothetical protein